ncbi:MAG: Ig-like domain-containing protein, partial [Solirubrobacteraceae bacterium]
MFSSRARAAMLLGSCALVFAASPISPAGAVITASQVTAPADPSYLLDNFTEPGGGSEFTVSGTATGTGAVDIHCYYGVTGSEYTEIAENVAVVAGAFSLLVTPSVLGTFPCVLRAVPHGNVEAHPPGKPSPFEGPRVAPSKYSVSSYSGNGLPYDYTLLSRTLTANLEISSVGSCGLGLSILYSTPDLFESETFFDCDAAVYGSNLAETRSGLQVDGANAYTPAAVEEMEFVFGKALPGALPVTVSVSSFNAATGMVTIQETDPIVKCSPEAAFPPTAKTCTSLVATGITLHRTWTTNSDDHMATVSDTWTSTDGAAHSLNIIYSQTLEESSMGGLFELPGSSSFAATAKGQHATFPGGPGTILFKGDPETPEAGDGRSPQGAITYDRSPSEAVTFVQGSSNPTYNEFEMPYLGTVPASGSYALRMSFAQAYGLPQARSLAEEALASYKPSVRITSPANGTTVTTPSVTVSGTANDSGALSSLTVNGAPVAVSSPEGAWSTSVALKAGANTITA